MPQSPRCLCQSSFCKIERRHALKFEGCEVREKKKKEEEESREMQPAREEDDGGGVALKDCFAKDMSFVLILLVFFFSILDL